MSTEIGVILRERLVDLHARFSFYVTDVGKPMGSQQRLGDVLRRPANARHLYEPHGRGFKRLLRRRVPSADEAGGTGQ
jgi:hypothetical protein